MPAKRKEALARLIDVLMAVVLAGIALLSLSPPALAQPENAATPLVRPGKPHAVRVWNRYIVELRATVAGLSPRERAARIQQRIEDLPPEVLRGEVKAAPAQIGRLKGILISVDDHILLGLVPQDVDPESRKTLDQLAGEAATQFEKAFAAMAEQQRLPVLLRGIAITLGLTLLLMLALWGIVVLRRRALRRLKVSERQRPLVLQGLNFAPLLTGFERGLIKLTAWGAIAIAVYLWLTFVLVQFPYFQPIGERLEIHLLDLLTDLGVAIVRAVPGLFTVLVIFVLTRLVTGAVSTFLKSVETGQVTAGWLEPELAKATRWVVVALIWVFALTVAYPYIPGSDTQAFKGISVLLGVMVSLGSAGLVNQVMSGLAIVYSRSFRLGDHIQAGEHEGIVSQMGILSAKIKNRRQEITIPNAVLVGLTITNYSRLAEKSGTVVASTSVTIGYDAPWRQVHAMLLLAAERTGGICNEPHPFVLQHALSDFYVEYHLNVHIEKPEDRFFVLSALHGNIQDVFNEHGVQIMSPHFEAQPESEIVVPKSRWHAPPADTTDDRQEPAKRLDE